MRMRTSYIGQITDGGPTYTLYILLSLSITTRLLSYFPQFWKFSRTLNWREQKMVSIILAGV